MAIAKAVPISAAFCPYVGLQPYSIEDREYFFGRERDQEIIFANLCSARLTILYGGSGVGKSSVVQAGVLPLLQTRRRTAVVYFRSWQQGSFLRDLKAACHQAVESSCGMPIKAADDLPLDELLLSLIQASHCAIFIVLDQFEELFTYHPEGQTNFDSEFASSVNRDDINANFLVVLRDDALSRLDRFRTRITNLLGNTLRIRHLDVASAELAIREPLKVYNRKLAPSELPMKIEDELVTALLGQLRPVSPAGTSVPADLDRIETPYLQLVLQRLWKEEVQHGSHILRRSTLGTNDLTQIVKMHFDEVMARFSEGELRVCASIFQFMVTADHAKIALSASALAEWGNVGKLEVTRVMEKLCGGGSRVMRTVAAPQGEPLYEIFHDVLAPAVLDWRTRWIQEQQRIHAEQEAAQAAAEQIKEQRLQAEEQHRLAEQRTRDAKTLRAWIVALSVLCVISIATLMYGYSQHKKTVAAEKQMRKAQRVSLSQKLAAEALGQSAENLDVALLLSMEAIRISQDIDGKNPVPAEVRGSLLADLISSPNLSAFFRYNSVLDSSGEIQPVPSVRFSPDGNILAAAQGKDIILWNSDSGYLYEPSLEGENGLVTSLAFDPTGKVIASGSEDGTVILWDIASGKRLAQLPGQNGIVWSIAFNSNGRFLISGNENGTVSVWTLTGYQPVGKAQIRKEHEQRVTAVAFSSKTDLVASGGEDQQIVLLDLTSGKVRKFTTRNAVSSLDFSPDGKTLAAGLAGFENNLLLHRLATGKDEYLTGHRNTVFGVGFSRCPSMPCEVILASAGADKKIILWDAANGKQRSESLTGNKQLIGSLGWGPTEDGIAVLATGSTEGLVALWNIPLTKWLGRPLRKNIRQDAFKDYVWNLHFIGKNTLVWSSSAGLYRATIDNNEPPVLIPGRSGSTSRMAISPGGQTIAMARDKAIFLTDLEKRGPLELSPPQAATVSSLALGSTENRATILASGGMDGKIQLWDVSTHQRLGLPFLAGRGKVSSLAFNPRNPNEMASAAGSQDDWQVTIWNLADPEHPVQRWSKQTSEFILSIVFSPDGQLLVTAGTHQINLWSVTKDRTSPCARPLTKHDSWVNILAFSPDGKMLASGSDDKSIILWDVETCQALGPPLKEQNARVYDLAFSPDGKMLASGSAAGANNWPLILWDTNLKSWQERACIIAGRSLTEDEWKAFLPDEPYRPACRPYDLVRKADHYALKKMDKQAASSFEQAVDSASREDSTRMNNAVCWHGSIDGYAKAVLPACERAVKLGASDTVGNLPSLQDSRGVARSLLGDYPGAIEDFKSFVQWAGTRKALQQQRSKREIWIHELESGRNPFDAQTLKALRNE